METFWNTIAAYNEGTLPVKIVWTLAGALLVVLLRLRPSRGVRIAMKLYMAGLNFWIAGVYYLIYCGQRQHNDMLALFWAIMGGIWIYDLVARNASLARTGHHPHFALPLMLMPLVYPAVSLLLGRSFPMITSPLRSSPGG